MGIFGLKRALGSALLVAGLVLLYMGYQATQSASEGISSTFSGRYSNETILLLAGGGACAVAGAGMLGWSFKRPV